MKISLCIVARNEELYIAQAIESALPVVDEAIVVDTGSTDGTVEVARSAGARVVQEEWPGDLAAAHALPIARASGDWVLALDGDEVLDPEAREDIQRLCASNELDGYFFTIRNYAYRMISNWRDCDPRDPLCCGASCWVPSQAVRLFRAAPHVEYRGYVHQTVAPSIVEAGGRLGETDVPIHHYGHIRVDRAKSPFYSLLQRQQTAATPADPRCWLDLGVLLQRGGQLAAALDAFRRAYELGRTTDAAFHLGELLLAMEYPSEALVYLHEAIEGNADDGSPQFDRADAFEVRAEALESLSSEARAEEAYRAALALRPMSPQATNNLAAMLADRGEYPEALDLLTAITRDRPGLAMPWATLGTLRLRTGDFETAKGDLERAVDISPDHLAAFHNLSVAHECLGHHGEAERIRRETARQFSDRAFEALELPVPERGRGPVELDLPRHAVVSVAESLFGGGGRVLVDVVEAIQNTSDGDRRPQVVLVGEGGDLSGQGLREALHELEVPVRSFHGRPGLRDLLVRLEPELVIYHWWSPGVGGPVRVADEPWIAVGHSALPMPEGYDAYVEISSYHSRFQRHLPSSRVHRIPNAIDLARFPPRVHPLAERVRIAMLTRLTPEKLPRRLLDFLPPLEELDAEVLIGGTGGRRWELEPEIEARGLGERVRFLGMVPTSEVPRFLTRCDIGLHLTETHEELMSMTLLEMMAAGLPIVAQPRGCVWELVEHEQSGLLGPRQGPGRFLARDPAQVSAEQQIRDHLTRLIRSPDLRRRLGANARHRAERFGLERYREAWRGLISEVAGGQGSARVAADTDPRPTALPGADRSYRPRLRYAIAATMRSGSSLLCEALRNTGLAGQPSELLDPSERTGLGYPVDTELAFFLRQMQQRATTPNGVFGFKILWAQLPGLLEQLGGRGVESPEAFARLEELFPDLRWLWLRRRDRLRQAISLVRATQSRRWTRRNRVRSPDRAELYDRAAIDDALRLLSRHDESWAAFFDRHELAPATVWYEDLARDYEGTALRALEAVGIEIPERVFFDRRDLERQADELTESWVARYRQSATV